jgi:hypothetical protein
MFIFNGCLCVCCQLPFAMFSLLVLFLFFISMITFAPPLAILISAMPCLRGLQYNVFDQFEPTKADPFEQGSTKILKFREKIGMA